MSCFLVVCWPVRDGNKLRINTASSWFLLHRCIETHRQQNTHTQKPLVSALQVILSDSLSQLCLKKIKEQFSFICTPPCHTEQFWGAIHPIATPFLRYKKEEELLWMLCKETLALHCLKSKILFHFTPNTYFHYQHLLVRIKMLSNKILQYTVLIQGCW